MGDWLTLSGFNSQCGTFISVCNQLHRSTQPGHTVVGRRNEYQLKGDDALQLRSKGRYGSCVSFTCHPHTNHTCLYWTHEHPHMNHTAFTLQQLRDPLVTHGPYLSALEMAMIKHCYINSHYFTFILLYLVGTGNKNTTFSLLTPRGSRLMAIPLEWDIPY